MTVAYAQALQFWVEKADRLLRANPSFGGECLRVEGGNGMLGLLSQ